MNLLPVLFWVFWFIGLLGGVYYHRDNFALIGSFGITWFLLLLLGLKVFGLNL